MTLQEQFAQAVRKEKKYSKIVNSDLSIEDRFEAKKKLSKWSDIADKLYNQLNA